MGWAHSPQAGLRQASQQKWRTPLALGPGSEKLPCQLTSAQRMVGAQ